MDLGLKDKVVLVTGAGKGMGQKIAVKFAQEGANLVLNDLKKDACQETALQVTALGRKATVVSADVSSAIAVRSMFDHIMEEVGRVDILVNNAGVLRACKMIDLTEEEWDQLVDINLKSVFLCSQAAARIMRKQGGGVIASASSYAALIPSIGQSAYAAAKAAVANLTRTMAAELACYNIRVVGYIPGVIETDLTRTMREENLAGLVDSIALKRCGTPDEVAGVVAFLCSDVASYITGSLVEVSGGKFSVQNARVGWE
ncbi:MAG: glucose 1-dehydrogenase [Bacteroidales bacterium]|nr:glucose 1-dehydrogenase [Bacteroidales bacterium]